MDERFNKLFKDILKHEGGYVNDPNDLGGETKYGISKRSYPHLDIPKLTEEQAKTIYYYDYWLKYHVDKLAKVSFQVASKYFDFLINAGEKNAKNVLIKSINELGYNVTNERDMNEDILLAVKEIVMTNKKDALINNFIKNQKQYYITIAEKRPQNKKFLNGWLRRAEYRGVTDYG